MSGITMINPKTGLCSPGSKEGEKFVSVLPEGSNRIIMDYMPPDGEIVCGELSEGKCLISGYACLPENRQIQPLP